MKWTKKQEEAIEARGQNILVSAAAGSGKTAVLVERMKELIIGEKVPVDRILVVTFTKAAASEMKDKIVRALHGEIGKDPENLSFLKEQADRTYRSSISTFHSFAMDVIRNYFYVIGADPNVNVCDETEARLMKSDSMDETFRYFFEEDSEEFRNFLRAYGTTKNEDSLKRDILALYEKIQSMPDTLDWLSEKVEFLRSDEKTYLAGDFFLFVMEDIRQRLAEAQSYYESAYVLLSDAGLSRLAEKVQEDIRVLEEMMHVPGGFDEVRENVFTYRNMDIRANKEEKEDYEEVKGKVSRLRKAARETIARIKETYLSDSSRQQVELMNHTYPYGVTLLSILRRFKEIYAEKKKDRNLVDFNDIEHYAIEILKNEQVSTEYREKFRYIFIDEYQDSNYLQEAIISRVRRGDNLFMVGDIKQSIYRFRLAEPAIFQNTYRIYSREENTSRKIDLNENFRSKTRIIDGINHIFASLMEDYGEEAALHEGSPRDEDIHYPVELHIIDTAGETDGEIQEELMDMEAAELEALAVSKVIKESLGQPVHDHKRGVVRPLEKKDIVILMRGVKSTADIFYKVLSSNDVPTYLDDNSGYFDTLEILTFLDLLRIIDNKQQDVALLSALRSPVFGFSPGELIRIRLENKETSSYYHAFEKYGREGQEEALRRKIADTLEKLEAWKKEASYTPIHEFVWSLMTRTGYYAFMGAMPGGTQRQANLRAFVDKTLAFGSRGNNTIFGLLRYIGIVGERQIETGQVSLLSENDDLVRIMTIHKSKGLEYPMVIVCGLGRKFISDRTKRTGSVHRDLGFAMSCVDPDRHWYKRTLGENAIAELNSRESMAEEIRILYVAATRAKDKLVLVGSVKDEEKYREKMELAMPGKNTYLDILAPHVADSNFHLKFHSRGSLGAYLLEEEPNKIDISEELGKLERSGSHPAQEAVHRILSYEYDHKEALKVRSKFSVSELSGKGKKTLTLQQPLFAAGKTSLTGAEKGTIMHTVMEHLDFSRTYDRFLFSEEACLSYVSDFVGTLVDREILTEEEGLHVSSQKIVNFFKSDIGRRSAQATAIHKERPFNILTEYQGTEVMVQGIIDCYFEEEGKLILLDYKTDYFSEGIEEMYGDQMRLYGEALEKTGGRSPDETYLYLFSEDRELRIEQCDS